MSTSDKKYKITYYSDDMELLNKMAFIAKQFSIKAEEHNEENILNTSAVVLNSDAEINKSERQEENDLNEFNELIKIKYKGSN
ncbi:MULTISPECIES: hypothetical protein [Yersinia]|uniref:hypothetical protein n=1 Tax=Yersinia TaxID=629 RepID=UPI0005AC366E|nr:MULTISPECIES: hypothetical protein [Yersinia]AJJ63637.1 hypothetical protein AT01_1696 [Yersinia aldovae 670-83]PJE87409.1 hypothetical protein CU280_13570 [Yersinia mollaretii]